MPIAAYALVTLFTGISVVLGLVAWRLIAGLGGPTARRGAILPTHRIDEPRGRASLAASAANRVPCSVITERPQRQRKSWGTVMPAYPSPTNRRRRAPLRLAAALALGALATAHAQTPAPAAPAAACDRACLTAIIDAYYAALIANDARKLPQAARARITENGAEKKLADTFWASADATIYRFDVVNTKRP